MRSNLGLRDDLMTRRFVALRIRRLFLPMVYLSAGFTAAYSLLNWLCVAKTGLIPLDESVANLWLPCGLAVVLVIILMRPHLRLLQIHAKRSNLPSFYYLAAIAVVAIPALVAQGYLHGNGRTHSRDGLCPNCQKPPRQVLHRRSPLRPYRAAGEPCRC